MPVYTDPYYPELATPESGLTGPRMYEPYPTGGYPTYQPTASTEPRLGAEPATEHGLAAGKSLLDEALKRTYNLPADISGQLQGPGQYNYIPFVAGPQYERTNVAGWQGPAFQSAFNMVDPNAALANYQRMNLPNAQQLMGGDYDLLQQQLMIPGQQAATRGYEESLQNLKNVMGGRGMYGSSVMGNQMVQAGDLYQQALAANAAQAAAQRYGMQQQDLAALNEFNLARTGLGVGQEQFATSQMQDLFGQNVERALQQQLEANKYGLAQDQLGLDAAKAQAAHGIAQAGLQSNIAQNMYKAGADETQRYQDYLSQALQFGMSQEEAQRSFQNQSLRDQFNYQMMQNQWQQQLQEMLMNQALALAGKGAPLASAQMTAQSQIDAAREARSAAENAAMYQAIGSVTGAAAPTVLDWASNFDWGSLW